MPQLICFIICTIKTTLFTGIYYRRTEQLTSTYILIINMTAHFEWILCMKFNLYDIFFMKFHMELISWFIIMMMYNNFIYLAQGSFRSVY